MRICAWGCQANAFRTNKAVQQRLPSTTCVPVRCICPCQHSEPLQHHCLSCRGMGSATEAAPSPSCMSIAPDIPRHKPGRGTRGLSSCIRPARPTWGPGRGTDCGKRCVLKKKNMWTLRSSLTQRMEVIFFTQTRWNVKKFLANPKLGASQPTHPQPGGPCHGFCGMVSARASATGGRISCDTQLVLCPASSRRSPPPAARGAAPLGNLPSFPAGVATRFARAKPRWPC